MILWLDMPLPLLFGSSCIQKLLIVLLPAAYYHAQICLSKNNQLPPHKTQQGAADHAGGYLNRAGFGANSRIA